MINGIRFRVNSSVNIYYVFFIILINVMTSYSLRQLVFFYMKQLKQNKVHRIPFDNSNEINEIQFDFKTNSALKVIHRLIYTRKN